MINIIGICGQSNTTTHKCQWNNTWQNCGVGRYRKPL